MSAHVLIVDDERKLADLLARYLEAAGYRVTLLYEGGAVIETVSRAMIDIVLLDWSLPDVDGLALCQRLRASSEIPIIMITARVDESDRIAGLETGADDYICKPFSPREVVARVGARLRHRAPGQPAAGHGLRIDALAHRVLLDTREVELTLVEFQLLKTLHTHPERAFTRDELIDGIYDDNRIVTDRTVDVHIKNLRHKLQLVGMDDAIATVYGLGYRWQSGGAVDPDAANLAPEPRRAVRRPGRSGDRAANARPLAPSHYGYP